MFLELRNLSKKFDNNTVVNNLNLSIKKGEILCLLGPSGCGKTTTLKMIGGFIKPDSGHIFIDGLDITSIPSERRPVSTVFQSYALFPHMNVIKNVSYGLKFTGCRKSERLEKAREYLKIVGLENYETSRIQELSGGQQQRVALARSLVINPKVLLLDEPLSNLDAKLREKMRQDIKSIQHKVGTTMIFVTHDQEEAMAIGDKIAVMNKGAIEQCGTPKDIYMNPNTPFVLKFIGNSNIFSKEGQTYFIRPESIILSNNSGDLAGIIESKSFMGSYTNYFVRCPLGLFTVKHSNIDKKENFQIGEKVHLKIINKKTI